MKARWKGALIGGIIGVALGLVFSTLNLGTSLCVDGLNILNFFCSLSHTYGEFGILATIISTPKLFFINLFHLSEFSEFLSIPLTMCSFILLGGLLGFLFCRSKK